MGILHISERSKLIPTKKRRGGGNNNKKKTLKIFCFSNCVHCYVHLDSVNFKRVCSRFSHILKINSRFSHKCQTIDWLGGYIVTKIIYIINL